MGQPDCQRVVGANASTPGYNDLIVGILFVVHVVVIVVCCFAFLGNGASIDALIDVGLRAQNTDLVRASVLTAFYATLFSLIYVFIYLLILKVAALLLIVLMMLAVVCLTIGGGIGLIAYAVHDKQNNEPREFDDGGYALAIIGGILCSVFGAVLLLWFCCIRSRVLLTAKMLSAVSEVIFTVPGTILVTFAMAILQFVWSFGAQGPGSCSASEQEVEAARAALQGQTPPSPRPLPLVVAPLVRLRPRPRCRSAHAAAAPTLPQRPRRLDPHARAHDCCSRTSPAAPRLSMRCVRSVWGMAMLQISMWVGQRKETMVTDPVTNVTSLEEGGFPWGAWTGMEIVRAHESAPHYNTPAHG